MNINIPESDTEYVPFLTLGMLLEIQFLVD